MNRETTQQVVWREGTLLRPQHFQHQQRQLQQEASMRVQLTRPNAWGLSELEIDQDALQKGSFVVRSVRALFADGTLLDLASDQCSPLRVNLKEHFKPETSSVLIHLCLSECANHPNVKDQAGSNSPLPGYESHNVEIQDRCQPGRRSALELAWPRVELRVGENSGPMSRSLPIVRLLRETLSQDISAAHTYDYLLDSTFIAPSLSLKSTPGLELRLQALLASVHQQYREFLAQRRQSNLQRLSIEGRDLETYLWLQALGSALATLQSMRASHHCSPYSLYLELSRLCGQLSGLIPAPLEAAWSGYTHHQPEASFDPLFEELHRILASRTIRDYGTIKLSRRSDGMWLSKIEDPQFSQGRTFVLAVRSQQSQELTAQTLPKLAKLATFRQISKVIANAISGAPLTLMTRPPDEVPARPGWIYFRVDPRSSYWQEVLQEHTLAFYAGSPFNQEDTEIQLFYVAPPQDVTIPLPRHA